MSEVLRHVTLRQLQIFMTAAESGSYLRTAQTLHLTQPAVSMQMAQLADSIGMPLFKKQGRTVGLTAAGEALLPYVRKVAQTLREAGNALDALSGAGQAKLSIALVTTTRYFAPKLITQFRSLHPEIELDISIANRENVIAALENDAVDLAIMGRPPENMDLVAAAFANHPHGVIAAAHHPLANKKKLLPSKLANEAFLSREPGSGTRRAMEEFFAQHDLQPPIAQIMTSNESIKQAVMAGMGLGFLSAHTVGLELQTGNLVLLDVKGLPIIRTWYILQRTDRRLGPAALAFKEFMLTQGAQMMEKLFPCSRTKDTKSREI